MKKLLLIALAALSFGSASAHEQADGTWKWCGSEKPAETEGASGTYYIRNVQTGMFLKTAETTLYVDNDKTCAVNGSLFTFVFHNQKDADKWALFNGKYGYKNDGYLITNANGKYLTWAGALLFDLDVNRDDPYKSTLTSQYVTHMMAGSKEEGYNIWFPSNIANTGISSGNYYLYVDESNPNTLTKSSKEDEKSPFAHWQLISQDEMNLYHQYLVDHDVLNLYKTQFGSDIKNGYTYTNIYVHRALKAGYNTIALPFDVDDVEAAFGEGAYVSKFTGAEEVDGASYTLTFTKQKNIEANVPYILHLNAATPEVTTFKNTKAVNEVSESATFAGWTFQSNYLPNQSMKDKYGVVNSTAKIMRGTETATINGLTAYFTFNGTALNSVQAIFVDGQGELTDIQQLEAVATENGQTIYTISGQRVNNAVNGINIINGRKVLKK